MKNKLKNKKINNETINNKMNNTDNNIDDFYRKYTNPNNKFFKINFPMPIKPLNWLSYIDNYDDNIDYDDNITTG